MTQQTTRREMRRSIVVDANLHVSRGMPIVRLFLLALAGAVAFAQDGGPSAASQPRPPSTGFQSEDSLSYSYGSRFRTPFVTTAEQPRGADIGRNSIEFTHLDFWKYGSNIVDLNLRMSNHAEPAVGGGAGALEVYGIFRADFSLNKIGGTRRFGAGPLRDIALEAGANLETKNSDYSPEERTLFLGPNFQFKIPRGFLNVGVHIRKEWNHEAILGKADNYSPCLNFETNWSVPLPIRRVPLAFAGFATLNTPKGKDSFGTNSVTEYLVRPRLMLDVGALAFHKRGLLEAGGGVEYWYNEFGKPASFPGATEIAPFFQLTLRLGRAE
jgi:hypothetical protein